MRHRPHNGLPRWLRRSLYLLTCVLLASGLAWLAVAYLLAPAGEETPAPHALAGPLLAAHGIAAYSALVVCGLVGHVHLRTGWRVGAMRVAGVVLGLLLVALALSGLGFYYVGNEAATPWLRWAHVAAGMALPGALGWHIVRGRRVGGHG